jgi:phenylacetate-CoA ligase
LEPADRLFFPFSFGPFLGFWAAFAGAARLGHFVLPGGGLNTGARLRFLLDNGITVVCCTPTYALRMAEVAAQEGLDLAGSPVRMLILAGEPGGSIAGTRQRIEAAWGARAFDHTGMTEIGSLGIECRENPGGVHLLETDCIAEIIDPETGRLVSREQEGELVLTNLGRWGSPLLRYRTGDRVLADPEPCPCGRVWLRLAGGIRGRTDDMLIVKGVNVYPSAVEDVVRRFATVDEFRLVVAAGLTVELECAAPPPRLAEEVAAAVQTALLFRPEVRLVAPGTLPRPEMKSRRVVRA